MPPPLPKMNTPHGVNSDRVPMGLDDLLAGSKNRE